jgi:hypothetical protein
MKRTLLLVLALVAGLTLQTCSSVHAEYDPVTSRFAVDVTRSFLSSEQDIEGTASSPSGLQVKIRWGSKTSDANAMNALKETAIKAIESVPNK